jgi:transcriptional regulator with XRE-family HTH domain
MMEDPGQKLKRVRDSLDLTYRDVEQLSAKIASARGDEEFNIALSRLADIENKGTVPTFHRLYSICAIYALDMAEVLSWYGVPMSTLPGDAALIQHARTHPLRFSAGDNGEVALPISLEPGLDLSKTLFLSRMIQRWGRLPLALLGNYDLRNHRYGFIGTDDWWMHPIIPPGSLVVIDENRRRIQSEGWSNEFERPIYFLEHRDGWACSWCILHDGQLTLIPHPSSNLPPKTFAFPDAIEVLGQVTAIAMTLDSGNRRKRS